MNVINTTVAANRTQNKKSYTNCFANYSGELFYLSIGNQKINIPVQDQGYNLLTERMITGNIAIPIWAKILCLA